MLGESSGAYEPEALTRGVITPPAESAGRNGISCNDSDGLRRGRESKGGVAEEDKHGP